MSTYSVDSQGRITEQDGRAPGPVPGLDEEIASGYLALSELHRARATVCGKGSSGWVWHQLRARCLADLGRTWVPWGGQGILGAGVGAGRPGAP